MIEKAHINEFAWKYVSGLTHSEVLGHLQKSESTLASLALQSGLLTDEKVSREDLGYAIKTYLEIAAQPVEDTEKTLKGYSGL